MNSWSETKKTPNHSWNLLNSVGQEPFPRHVSCVNSLIFTLVLWRDCYYYLHFTNMETGHRIVKWHPQGHVAKKCPNPDHNLAPHLLYHVSSKSPHADFPFWKITCIRRYFTLKSQVRNYIELSVMLTNTDFTIM